MLEMNGKDVLPEDGSPAAETPLIIDAHQHLWDLSMGSYKAVRDIPALARNFQADELATLLTDCGVAGTVLVQSEDSNGDTDFMLQEASRHSWILGVVGWVPLKQPDLAAQRLAQLADQPLCGIRHLIHNERDPDWLIRPEVNDGLKLIADLGLPLDVVAVLPRHLQLVPVLAEQHPDLRMIIDHAGKPQIGAGEFHSWSTLISTAAEAPNVFVKLSGLDTATMPRSWSAGTIQTYVDHIIRCFTPERVMFGSDWPVNMLGAGYKEVLSVSQEALAHYSTAEKEAILGGTALRAYRLDPRVPRR